MNLYPAIDLRGGMCVRLEKGNFSKETVYSKDPGAMARRFAEAGARTIHVVDLDGALAGKSENLSAIKAILREGGISIEVGGGIRTYEQIEGLVERANRDFPHKIVVGIDAKNGYAAADGWEKDSNLTAEALARRVAAAGTERIIFTDIIRDGMMNGSNIVATAALYQACGVPITASGGVSSLEDIRRLKARETDGIEGCIIGKALYAGAFSLSDALKIAGEV